PAFAAPGMMAAQTGQLEYRNQRRRELEAIAMQQAEMAQRQAMQNQNLMAGFQKQAIGHQMDMQRLGVAWQQGAIDQQQAHQNRLQLQQNDHLNKNKIAQQNAQAAQEEAAAQAAQDEEERVAQVKADYEASIENNLTPQGIENRHSIHAEYEAIKIKLDEENAPPEAYAQAEEDYENRLNENKNNPLYRKPRNEHYPGERNEYSGKGEHTVYDNDGRPTTVFAGNMRNENHIPNTIADPRTGWAMKPDGTFYKDPTTGLPVPYEPEFLPYSSEQYLYDKREWRGSEEDGDLEYREGTLDENGVYKPGTKWVNVAEENTEKRRKAADDWYEAELYKWNMGGQVGPAPVHPLAPPPTGGAPTDDKDPVLVNPDGNTPPPAGGDGGGVDGAAPDLTTAYNAYPELAGAMAGDMSMEESMLTMGIRPETAGNPDAVQLTPEQIEVRAQFDRPDALPRMEPQDYGMDNFVKKQQVSQYDAIVERPDGSKGPIPIYAVAAEDRQKVYENRRTKPYVINWPGNLDFNQRNLAGALLDPKNSIPFGTMIDLSTLTGETGKAFAEAWKKRTGSTNFVFEREFMLNIAKKSLRGQEYNEYENKVIRQEKEHYEFYGFPGDFKSGGEGSALDDILKAGGVK
ncbi:hypothetical protein, partial [Acinetobacter sp.]|uniref:hypothetical protein n=1 Tax=Acinetobacter sp. TaxID=472 RepID=UPI000C095CBD